MNSYIMDIIIKSKEDNCKRLNYLIKTDIIKPLEIIKIILSVEIDKEYVKVILTNILFYDIREFKEFLNYLSEISSLNSLIMLKKYFVPRLKKIIKADLMTFEEQTRREYIGIIFPIQLDSCIRNLSEKIKEEEIKRLLESDDPSLIQDFFNNNLNEQEYSEIIKKYSNNLRKNMK